MKLLATSTAAFVLLALFNGCDSESSPTQVTVRDTIRIHDTTYLNDRFAKSNPIVHGIWKIATLTDTGSAIFFQESSSVSVTIDWKSGSTWELKSTKLSKDSLFLSGDGNKLSMWAKFSDSADHKITKMGGTYINLNVPLSGTIPTWQAVRTF